MSTDAQLKVVQDIIVERERQDSKWGEQNYSFADWLAILSEEIGELSHEYLESWFEAQPGVMERMREEAVQ